MTTYRISCDFPRAWLPAWQDGLQVTLTSGGNQALTMRGVPDASGDADPETGYDVRIDGTDTVIGGTSAVAPLWAGLIARINRYKSAFDLSDMSDTMVDQTAGSMVPRCVADLKPGVCDVPLHGFGA